MTTTAQRTNCAPRFTAKCTATHAPTAWPAPSSKPSVQLHLIVDDEYDERGRREHEHDEVLHRVRANQVIAGTEHEAREHE